MILYGNGQHGRVIREALAMNQQTLTCIFDDAVPSTSADKLIRPYDPNHLSETPLIIAIGNNESRKIISEKINHPLASLVHPQAYLAPSARLGAGSVLLTRSITNTGAVIGRHCIVNSGAIVEHDVVLEDFVHLAPGVVVCGGVQIGELSLIGANCTINPGIRIGKNVKVAAGRVVSKDIPDHSLVLHDWV